MAGDTTGTTTPTASRPASSAAPKASWSSSTSRTTRQGLVEPRRLGQLAARPGDCRRRQVAAGGDVPGRIETGRWYDIRIELAGEKIKCYLDGKLIQDRAIAGGRYAGPRRRQPGHHQRRGALEAGQRRRLARGDPHRPGGRRQAPAHGHGPGLSGDPADENTLDEPAKVVPVARTVEGVSSNFVYTLPAQSVVILRLKPQ